MLLLTVCDAFMLFKLEVSTVMGTAGILRQLIPAWTVKFVILEWRRTKTDLLLMSPVVLINILCSASTIDTH